jgi:peptidoglycan/xylan/chitin deacetylase (PgdA/CDA1 family)
MRDRVALALRKGRAISTNALGGGAKRFDAHRGEVAVLMYHRVLPDEASVDGIEPGMYVRAQTFERQLTWIRKRFAVRTLGDLIQAPPTPRDPPSIAITFDDGWRDNLTVAWPILSRLGLRATIFLVERWVREGRNPEGDFMSPSDVAALHAQGMEFGAHTVSHPRLTRLGDEEIRDELRRSRDAVEAWTSAPCTVFAYPFGDHDDRVAAQARGAFRGAVVVSGGWWVPGGDLARVPRIGIHEDMTSSRAMFQARLAR